MNDLFCENGCLTDYALNALINEADLPELNRLEISEHLAFCDCCLEKYTLLLDNLSDEQLHCPPKPLAPSVKKRIAKHGTKLFFNRYVTVAAAAGFAIIFTLTGIFGSIPYGKPSTITTLSSQVTNISTAKENIVKSAQENLQNILDFFTQNDKGDNN